MDLCVVGVVGRTVSTADRQCHLAVAILIWPEDAAGLVVEGLEVHSVVDLEGVGTQPQHHFHHDRFGYSFCFVFSTSVRLIDLYYLWSSFILLPLRRVALCIPIRKMIDHLLHLLDYNGRDT